MAISDPAGSDILARLGEVEQMRRLRRADAELSRCVAAVKAFQAERFRRTYADLLDDRRYAAATRFFLEELYGPQEFGQRDSQFARVVPALVRLFPRDVVKTVADLGALHALSESLDQSLAQRLTSSAVSHSSSCELASTIGTGSPSPVTRLGAADYVRAWQQVGRADARERQVQLTLSIGQDLDRYTRNSWLRGSLRMMRRPAEAAGLAELQRFLERGFDAFAAMHGSQEFLGQIELRERALVAALFEPAALAAVTARPLPLPAAMATLGQLP